MLFGVSSTLASDVTVFASSTGGYAVQNVALAVSCPAYEPTASPNVKDEMIQP